MKWYCRCRRVRFVPLLIAACLMLGTLLPLCPRADAAAAQYGNASLPGKGELLLEGTVETPPFDVAAPQGEFVLKAVRTTAPDGTVTPLTPPRLRTVRYAPTTRLLTTDPMRPAVRADLDFGATVMAVGRLEKTANGAFVARTVQIVTGASEALGANLLPPTDDGKAWHGFLQPGVADGAIAPVPGEPGVIRVVIRKTDGVIWHAQCSLRPILKGGTRYVLRFRARADTPRLIIVDSSTNPLEYHNLGLHRVVPLDGEWRAYREIFTAAPETKEGSASVAPAFLLGSRVGEVRFADIALAEVKPGIAAVVPAVSAVAAPDMQNLLFHPEDTNGWMFQQTDPASGTLSDARDATAGSALKITVTAQDAPKLPYSVQVFQMTELEPGRRYRLRFRARADAPRTLMVNCGSDRDDYHLTGLDETAALGTEWRDFSYSFTAEKPDTGHTKAPVFNLGDALGTVWIAQVVLEAMPSH